MLLMLLFGTCGCFHSADLVAEEKRLAECRERLEELKWSIKDLPALQAQARQLEAENKKLRARLARKSR